MNTSLFMVLVAFIVTVETTDCSSKKSSLPTIKLKNDLFCGYYNSHIRPVSNHKNPTNLTIKLLIKYFNYAEYTDSFTIGGWIVTLWKDEHLRWDPEEYNSITTLQMWTDKIWTPGLSVMNQRISGSSGVIGSVHCLLYSSGFIVCVVPIHESSLCVGDLTAYPFDTQYCTVRFGSWIHSEKEINFTLTKSSISTEDLVPNGYWELLEHKATKHSGKYKCCPNDTYPSIDFSFKIRRLAEPHAASVILPALVLMVITLTSLWIPPDHSNRLSLCCVNLLCEFLFLQYVSFLVPLNGEKIPLIILFARDSLLLSVFTIVFSVILKYMMDSVKPVPGWMTNTVSILTAFRVGQFVLLNESSDKQILIQNKEDDLETKSNFRNKEWLIFVKILDRICFVIYFVVYLVMYVYTAFSIL